MNHIIWDVFTAMRARTCYRLFVITLFRALYSTCRHILIPSNPRLNYQKILYSQVKVPNGQRFLTDHVGLMVDRAVNRLYLWRFDMARFRGLLYSLAKLMGDYNAVNSSPKPLRPEVKALRKSNHSAGFSAAC